MEEKKPDYLYILASAGTPQMYSHPIDGHGAPPEMIKQPLGWHSEKEGFAVRLFKYEKKTKLRESEKDVLIYREVTPNPALCYRAIDFSYFADEVWETPTQRNVKAALRE